MMATSNYSPPFTPSPTKEPVKFLSLQISGELTVLSFSMDSQVLTTTLCNLSSEDERSVLKLIGELHKHMLCPSSKSLLMVVAATLYSSLMLNVKSMSYKAE